MKKKRIALAYGVVCHLCFVLGVGLMMYSLYLGLPLNILKLSSSSAWAWNSFLVLQFPILHSFFLQTPGRRILSYLAPAAIRSDLSTTLFACFASVQLILVFGTWSGSQRLLWQPSSATTWYLLSAAYLVSWLLLLKSMADAGLAVQTGALGWWAVFCEKKPVFRKFPTTGLNRFTRNPIYVSFTLILLSAPVWTWDRLLLAVPWSIYCLLGPLFKEKRYRKFFGNDYREYQQRVPYWLPRWSN